MADRRAVAFGSLLILDFVVTAVMLVTDKNLQTDFGGSAPYYVHWYGALGMGILDLVAGGVVLALSVRMAPAPRSQGVRRGLMIGALVWTILAILAMVAVVETFQQVGFQNANQFAQYLFGVTAYPGVLSYIPWLYDLLLVLYVVTAIGGVVAIRRPRVNPAIPIAPS